MPRRRRMSFMGLIKLLVLLFIVAALVGLGFYAFLEREALNRKPEDVPLIEAPKLALKARPTKPGGMVIPHRDKQVYDLLKKTQTAPPAITLAQTAPSPTVTAQPATTTPPPKPAATTKIPQPAQKSTPKKADDLASLITKAPEARPAPKAEPKPDLKQPEPPRTNSLPTGDYGVQVASFKSRADAQRAQVKIASAFPNTLRGLTPIIQEVTLNDGSTRFRLRFGSTTRTKASEIGASLKRQKQDNFLVKVK